ncbi:MAG: long-chain fatty acid--CoA ligase [Burkholderiales bacterium 70-64]|nr:MAG: long-chain fatty acid--CoA ligase [Burkholderiales bacterium 70-64]
MMPVPLSLNRLLEHAGRQFPQSEVVSRLPDKSLRRHTYSDLYRRTRALAAALRQLGLRKGDRVATLCWNHHAHLECYFGIPAAGGVMHTLNLRLAPDDIGWIAHHAGDRFLVVDDILLPLYRQFATAHRFERVIVFRFGGTPVAGEAATTEAAAGEAAAGKPAAGRAAGAEAPPPFEDYERLLARAPADFEYAAHDENDPVAMCYTSGTTGKPKGVVYSHRSTVLHSLSCALPDYVGLSCADTVMPVTPMFHANSWGIPYAAVMLGAKLVFPGPHLHPEDLLDLMQAEPPTLTLGVPTIWLALIQACEADPGRWRLPAGMRSMVGGAAVPESLIRQFARHGIRIAQGWGMTETSPMGSLFFEKPELRGSLGEDEWFARKALAGIPGPLVEVRIMGEDGPCAWNGRDVGELQVRGPFIAGSYHGEDPDSGKFTGDGWLRTGDVAAIDPQGYIRIADRTKDLIKSGGEWISSVELENAIMAHPAVAEAAVIAVPHPKWLERPLACVVRKPGAALEADELLRFLAPGFARWQLPDAIEFIEAVPRTSTGKFWKAKLRERYAGWEWP